MIQLHNTRIYPGDNRVVLPTFPAASVHCVVTSPPYWGQRDYGTAEWEGGDQGCDHVNETRHHSQGASSQRHGRANVDAQKTENFWRTCGKCGARRIDSQVGLEPSPQKYVDEMVAIFREVRRVLRDDGTLWLNLGDKYASNPAKGRSGAGKNSDYLGGVDATSQTRGGELEVVEKNLLGIPWRVALALQADGWVLRGEIIWCLSQSTRVYVRSRKGVMPMDLRDLSRLDPKTVELWNGSRWTQLLGMSRSTASDGIQISLRSGEILQCTPGHQWPTNRGLRRADELMIGDVISSCKLPDTEKPDCKIDADVAWFIGLYIAEGNKNDRSVGIASHSKELDRLGKCKAIASAFNGTCRHYIDGNCMSIVVNSRALVAILDEYVVGRTSHDKRLTTKAWSMSDSWLAALLDGYLSGDGGFDEGNDRWRLSFTDNRYLVNDIRTLCARLGYTLTCKRRISSYKKARYYSWGGEIRKTSSGHWNCKDRSEVVALGRFNRGEVFYDLGVDGDPHLFALASGVLSHNSKPNAMPGSQRDRPSTNHEHVFLFAKQPRYYYDDVAIREPAASAGRIPGGGGKYTGDDIPGLGRGHTSKSLCETPVDDERTKRSVWTVPVAAERESHFAAYPPKLIEPCILAGTSAYGVCAACGAPYHRVTERTRVPTRPGRDTKVTGNATIEGNRDPERHTTQIVTTGWRKGCGCPGDARKPAIVLDPFGGTGTSACVAIANSRRAVLIELNPEYIEIQKRKIAKWAVKRGFGINT